MEILALFIIVGLFKLANSIYTERENIENSHALALITKNFVIQNGFLFDAQYYQYKQIDKRTNNLDTIKKIHGDQGEHTVMRLLADTQPIAVYGGVHVYPHNKMLHHEVDHIAVYPECTLLLETKNLSSIGTWKTNISFDPNFWVNENKHGRKGIHSPFHQAKIARDSVRDVLEKVKLHLPTWSIVAIADAANLEGYASPDVWHCRISKTTAKVMEARQAAPEDATPASCYEFMLMLAKNGVYPKYFDDKALIKLVQDTKLNGGTSKYADRLERPIPKYEEIKDTLSNMKNTTEVQAFGMSEKELEILFLGILQNIEQDKVKKYLPRCRGFFSQHWTAKDGTVY